MLDLNELLGHWGYAAIFFVVILGNMGLPVPEEAVLMVAGYLVREGELRLPGVLVIGIVSAVMGDNFGYWVGRKYGQGAIERYGHWVYLTEKRIELMEDFMARRGMAAVYFARFLPGLRFLAGPLAGALRLRFLPFLTANLLGSATYVPVAVGVGYAIAYGFGPYLDRVRRVVGHLEIALLAAILLLTLILLTWRMFRARRKP